MPAKERKAKTGSPQGVGNLDASRTGSLTCRNISSFYFDKVSGFLAPQCCEPIAEVCNDGVDNDCDTQVDCDDDNCAGNVACIFSCGSKNAACEDNLECCSGICKRNGRCR